jgi:hypothetical protein
LRQNFERSISNDVNKDNFCRSYASSNPFLPRKNVLPKFAFPVSYDADNHKLDQFLQTNAMNEVYYVFIKIETLIQIFRLLDLNFVIKCQKHSEIIFFIRYFQTHFFVDAINFSGKEVGSIQCCISFLEKKIEKFQTVYN